MPAAQVGQFDQSVSSFLLGLLKQGVRNFFIRHQIGQTVRTQKQQVTVLQ